MNQRTLFLHKKYFSRGLLALFILNILDLITTIIALNNNYGDEINPLANHLWKNYGILGITILKLLIIPLIFYLAYMFYFKKENNPTIRKKSYYFSFEKAKTLHYSMITMNLIYSLVIVNNTSIIISSL